MKKIAFALFFLISQTKPIQLDPLCVKMCSGVAQAIVLPAIAGVIAANSIGQLGRWGIAAMSPVMLYYVKEICTAWYEIRAEKASRTFSTKVFAHSYDGSPCQYHVEMSQPAKLWSWKRSKNNLFVDWAGKPY